MKMTFRLGNTNFKIKYNNLDGFRIKDNPYEDMLARFGMHFLKGAKLQKQYWDLYRMYENIPSNLLNYYKNANKMFEEYINLIRANFENSFYNKDYMPANGHDIFNYVARYGLANHQIQSVIKIDGHLDYGKLSKAVRLSIDEQPIFGCHFIENEIPYWKMMDRMDENHFCSLEICDNSDETVQRFLESPLDMDNDPMLKINLIRSPANDIICIKINHACCDGIGTKEYVQLLSEIYTIIDQDYGIFIPKPAKRNRSDQDKLFTKLGIVDPETEWITGSEITKASWPFPWKQIQLDANRIVFCKSNLDKLDKLIDYSKKRGATINDLILTAYYRAMPVIADSFYEEPKEISVTIDLRRYLPDNKTEGIRNFSGSEIAKITMVPNETFAETLSRIVPIMKEIKNSRPGLQSAIGLERIEKLPFNETLNYYKSVSQWPYHCSDKCSPVLSNLGFISDSLLRFGKKVATDYYIVPPVVRAPGFLLMISSYNGILTFMGGIYEGSVQREEIEGLLERIKYELEEGCQL